VPLLVPRLPRESRHYGLLAHFAGPRELYRACEEIRDAGYTRWDAHTPFPVHGLERAMGLRASRLPWIVLVMGLCGAGGGMLLQWWVHTRAYPLVISGKPLFSWPAFVPVTFELGVLFAALGAVFGMLALNQLPTYYHPLFHSGPFERFSTDAFFVSIEAWDPLFDERKTAELLHQAGATRVERIEP
jgi:hypothetical protein